MKSIISLLLCSLLLIGCATSQATEITQKPILTPPPETQQEVRPHGQAFLLPKNVICNDSKVMYDLIRTSQGDVTMMAQIFIDKENRKFSIVESSTEGISCVISAGFDFDILPHSHPGEIQKGSGQEVNKGIHKLPQKIRMQN